MYIKKLRRKCNVRGCRNTESYAISKTREMGNSIIVCKECLEEALKKIEEYENFTFKEATPVEAHTEPAEAFIEEDKVNTPTEEETLVEAPVKRKRGK